MVSFAVRLRSKRADRQLQSSCKALRILLCTSLRYDPSAGPAAKGSSRRKQVRKRAMRVERHAVR